LAQEPLQMDGGPVAAHLQQPQVEVPATSLVDPAPVVDGDRGDDGGGGADGRPESQSVCSVVLRPDGVSVASGCNDHLVRNSSWLWGRTIFCSFLLETMKEL